MMEAILRSVPEEMVLNLGAKETAKEAWETIKTLRIGVERVRESKAQTLRLQYEEIRFKAGEQVDDFALRLQGLVNELATLGDPIDNKMVILKFLRVVPRQYKQLAWSIESLVDLSTMTIEELVGRLKVVEERGDEADNRAGGELYCSPRSSGTRSFSSAATTALPAVGEAPPREAEVAAEAEAAPRAVAATAVASQAGQGEALATVASAATATCWVTGSGIAAGGKPTRQPRQRQTSSKLTWTAGRQ